MTNEKRKILCFSGWGQKYNSLEPIFKDNRFANFAINSCNYCEYFGYQELVAKLLDGNNGKPLSCDVAIGWSLGGQISLKLIADQVMAAKKLILIAPPFQMVKDLRIKAGMAKDVFAEFYSNFANSPDTTLKKFSILTAMNDKNASKIAKNLDINDQNHQQLTKWLEELKNTSFFDFDFSNIPHTLFFHGKGDMIVHILQMSYFKERIANFSPKVYDNCGHAVHLSDVEKVGSDIIEFLDN